MPLLLIKRTFGASPWRIALQHPRLATPEAQVRLPHPDQRELPGACFQRKREAQALLHTLNTLGDWDAEIFPVEMQEEAMRSINCARQETAPTQP